MLIIKYRPKKNVIIEGIFKFSIEMNGIGIVSAKYNEIKEILKSHSDFLALIPGQNRSDKSLSPSNSFLPKSINQKKRWN